MSGIFAFKKGQNTPNATNEGVENDGSQRFNGIESNVSDLMGDENAGNVMLFEYEYDEDIPKFINFRSNNFDKDYTVTTVTAEQKIYSVFNQEVFYRIKNGSMGFSSEIMSQAYEYYSTVTSKERRMIERAFDLIMKYFSVPVATTDFTIKPLKYMASYNDVNGLVTLYEKDMLQLNSVLGNLGFDGKAGGEKYLSDMQSTPLSVRLGVGGTQSLQLIISDVTLSDEQKVSTLMILFSLSEEDAKKMIYGNTSN